MISNYEALLLQEEIDDLNDRLKKSLEYTRVLERMIKEAKEGWIEVYPPRDGWTTITRPDIAKLD